MFEISYYSLEEQSFNSSENLFTVKDHSLGNLDFQSFLPQASANISLNEVSDNNDEVRYFIKDDQYKTELNQGNNNQVLTNYQIDKIEEETVKDKEKEELKITKTKFTTNTKRDKVPKKNGKNLGRKRNEIKNSYQDDSKHGKYSEDNMMRKIKTNLLEYILNSLNNSLINKNIKFYRIDKEISENLKKDFNLNLLDRTIYNIFYNTKTSKKYTTPIDEFINQTVIDKIILENKEIETIKILNKKFIDIINEIKSNKYYYTEFFNIIKEKENKNEKYININEYIDKLKDLFSRYESWFNEKKGRNRDRKIK